MKSKIIFISVLFVSLLALSVSLAFIPGYIQVKYEINEYGDNYPPARLGRADEDVFFDTVFNNNPICVEAKLATIKETGSNSNKKVSLEFNLREVLYGEMEDLYFVINLSYDAFDCYNPYLFRESNLKEGENYLLFISKEKSLINYRPKFFAKISMNSPSDSSWLFGRIKFPYGATPKRVKAYVLENYKEYLSDRQNKTVTQ